MKGNQAGYNMLELIMAIAIIGVLAGVAVPKFINTNTSARISAVTTLMGSLEAANKFVYVKASTAGVIEKAGSVDCTGGVVSAPATGSYVDMGGGTNHSYVCTSFGFARDATELARLIDLKDDIVVIGSRLEHSKATNRALCGVTYTPAASSTAPPAYVINTPDCS